MDAHKIIKPTISYGRLSIPEGYKSHLDLMETEEAIKFAKDSFQIKLARLLNLKRVSAPMTVLSKTGINDHLNGVEKPVSFKIRCMNDPAEIVQSLAKWKRMALADYRIKVGEGLYTDMNAIRPDEELDNLHSIYVDQWDWEKTVTEEDRNLEFLKTSVRKIYGALKHEENEICNRYTQLPGAFLPDNISFIHSEELEERFPEKSPQEREYFICREKKAVFIIGIGSPLKNGQPHDGRAADYDDWSTTTDNGKKGLNGDIIIWYPLLQCAFELSSMGIRVDKNSLMNQLEIREENEKASLYFHQRLLKDELPQSIGGGIGQSRLCMLFLRKAHVGEVQSSIWPKDMIDQCRQSGIFLL